MSVAKSLQEIKDSCLHATECSGIKISESAIDAFLDSLDKSQWDKLVSKHDSSRLPLAFENEMDELNFHLFHTFVNVLSGYRLYLHQTTSQGASDTIMRFCISCFLSANSANSILTARGMSDVRAKDVAELLNIQLMTEKPHPTLPVTVGEKDPVAEEIVNILLRILNQTGKILIASNHKTLASWMVDKTQASQAVEGGEEQKFEWLLQQLVSTFPALQDSTTLNGKPVYIYKKAILALNLIRRRFASSSTIPPVPTTAHIPLLVDNVLPTLCLYFKILDLTSCTAEELVQAASVLEKADTKTEMAISSTSAYILRAATLTAGEAIVARATSRSIDWQKEMNAVDLDTYLWLVAKDDPALRALPRFAEKNTVFY